MAKNINETHSFYFYIAITFAYKYFWTLNAFQKKHRVRFNRKKMYINLKNVQILEITSCTIFCYENVCGCILSNLLFQNEDVRNKKITLQFTIFQDSHVDDIQIYKNQVFLLQTHQSKVVIRLKT